jgi:hypothetical protein
MSRDPNAPAPDARPLDQLTTTGTHAAGQPANAPAGAAPGANQPTTRSNHATETNTPGRTDGNPATDLQVEPRAQHAHGEPGCANCGALLSGRFCSNCGQRREHEIQSIWHFTQEATEDLTHADSRLWSTMMALMLKPGLLTREFLAGRRVKYLPPLRLYLVLSVIFFLILSSARDHDARALAIHTEGGKTTIAMVNLSDAQDLAAKPGETPEQRADRICKPEYEGPGRDVIVPFLNKGCRRSLLDNGHTVAEATLHNIPRAMFIFVPALAAVMKLMYWRPRRYYIEHLLFFVHTHAFIFALFGLYVLLLRLVPAALDDWIQPAVWSYAAYYLFVSMRRVYGQGRFITFVKFGALSFTYLIGAALTLVLTVTYSVYAL